MIQRFNSKKVTEGSQLLADPVWWYSESWVTIFNWICPQVTILRSNYDGLCGNGCWDKENEDMETMIDLKEDFCRLKQISNFVMEKKLWNDS